MIRLEVDQEIRTSCRPNFNGLGPVDLEAHARRPPWSRRDQQTIVIGGLMADASHRAASPRSRSSATSRSWASSSATRPRHVQKTNILIALTPYVINDQSDLRRVLEKKMKERREFVERFGQAGGRQPRGGDRLPAQARHAGGDQPAARGVEGEEKELQRSAGSRNRRISRARSICRWDRMAAPSRRHRQRARRRRARPALGRRPDRRPAPVAGRRRAPRPAARPRHPRGREDASRWPSSGSGTAARSRRSAALPGRDADAGGARAGAARCSGRRGGGWARSSSSMRAVTEEDVLQALGRQLGIGVSARPQSRRRRRRAGGGGADRLRQAAPGAAGQARRGHGAGGDGRSAGRGRARRSAHAARHCERAAGAGPRPAHPRGHQRGLRPQAGQAAATSARTRRTRTTGESEELVDILDAHRRGADHPLGQLAAVQRGQGARQRHPHRAGREGGHRPLPHRRRAARGASARPRSSCRRSSRA